MPMLIPLILQSPHRHDAFPWQRRQGSACVDRWRQPIQNERHSQQRAARPGSAAQDCESAAQDREQQDSQVDSSDAKWPGIRHFRMSLKQQASASIGPTLC
jgi:FtsZ-interacting cell division protein ZipA